MEEISWLIPNIETIIKQIYPHQWYGSIIKEYTDLVTYKITFAETIYFNPEEKNIISENISGILSECLPSTSYNLIWSSNIKRIINVNNVEVPAICLDILIYTSNLDDMINNKLSNQLNELHM